MNTCIPLPLDDFVLKDVSEKAKDWALLHGAVMRNRDAYSTDRVSFAPFTLLPTVFKREGFEVAVKIQTSVNTAIQKISSSYDFLNESLKNTIEGDQFTKRLFDIYDVVRNEGISQPISLGILRTDYLPNSSHQLKQVEMNTVSCAFVSLSRLIGSLHRFTLTELDHQEKLINLPDNNALEGVANGIYFAWKYFGVKDSVILFLVEERTLNIADQRFIEYEMRDLVNKLKEGSCPKILRRTFEDINKRGTLNNRKQLVMDGYVVAVVYMRTGYTPEDYLTEADWQTRLMMERSTAIKCPNIQQQLAGTKKVQQVLAEPGVVERFTSDKAVRETFTNIYSLDSSEEGEKACALGMSDPHKYVLKPQREGGGNNAYGDDVSRLLDSMSVKERQGWILMELIEPPPQDNILVRPGPNGTLVSQESIISELGVFGVIVWDGEKTLLNESVGHMLRTKPRHVNEGGVAAGFGLLDSPYLQ